MALICKKNITPSIFIPYGLEIELENVEFEYHIKYLRIGK